MLRLPSLALSVAVAAFAVAGASADNPQIPPPGMTVFVPPPPPGELVDVGGRKLHILCKGSGPSVIIEAGLSQFTASSSYGKALDAIAPFAHVCLYDRAGLGWSDPAPQGRTHRDMVEDLHRLLRAAHLKGPHILVGHSMGGLLVRLYAHLYPRDVAGIVLADSSTEEDLFAPGAPADRAALVAKITDGLKVSKPHVPMVPIPAGTVADAFIAFTPETFTALRDEYQAIDRTPDSMRGPAGYGTLGKIPLIVIARGRMSAPPSTEDLAWRAMQQKLATLSSNSLFLVADQSGHVIPYDQPQIVADAVRRMIDANGGPLTTQ